MAFTMEALRTELQTDPLAYGYSAFFATDLQKVADLVNKLRDGTDGFPAITVKRKAISPVDILEAIDTRDFEASLSTIIGSWFESLTQYPSIELVNDDGTDTRVLGNLKRILQNPGPQGSRARVIAIAQKTGSRAEQLFGTGTVVTWEQVAQALGS